MLPAAFEYHRPESLDEALALLSTHGDEGKVLAGGQSLIPLMKLRFAAPGHLIDINRIPGLDGLEEADGQLRIGALTRHATLEHSDLLKQRYPVMAAGRADDLRPHRPEPRHDRRVARPRRPRRRLGLGDARDGRHGRREVGERGARDPDRRVPAGHVHDLPGTRRDRHRDPRPAAGREERRRLPEDGTQGRRLRHGRGGRPPRAVERHDRPRRHRAHGGRLQEHPGHRGRAVARRRRADRRRRSPRPAGWPRRPPIPSPTSEAPRSTSGTSSTSSSVAAWPGPSSRPAACRGCIRTPWTSRSSSTGRTTRRTSSPASCSSTSSGRPSGSPERTSGATPRRAARARCCSTAPR